jgi:hypothetical protein
MLGFGPALWIAAGLSVAGIVAARSRQGAPREVVPAGMRVAAAGAD